MQLSDEDLKEFIEIWEQEFKEDISLAQARERANQLLELLMLVSKREFDSPKPLPP